MSDVKQTDKKQTTMYISQEQIRRLKYMAFDEGTTVTALVEKAITQFIEAKEQPIKTKENRK